MREFLGIVAAFTIGALLATVKYEREISALKVESATMAGYSDGESDGYRTGVAETRAKLSTVSSKQR
jgi:hypothetical protein